MTTQINIEKDIKFNGKNYLLDVQLSADLIYTEEDTSCNVGEALELDEYCITYINLVPYNGFDLDEKNTIIFNIEDTKLLAVDFDELIEEYINENFHELIK